MVCHSTDATKNNKWAPCMQNTQLDFTQVFGPEIYHALILQCLQEPWHFRMSIWHNRNATANSIHALLPGISRRAWYNDTHMHYTCTRYTSALMKTCHSHVSHAEGFGQMLEVFFVACHSTDALHSCIVKKVCFSKQYFISLSHSFRT